jgi:hypothetical protein
MSGLIATFDPNDIKGNVDMTSILSDANIPPSASLLITKNKNSVNDRNLILRAVKADAKKKQAMADSADSVDSVDSATNDTDSTVGGRSSPIPIPSSDEYSGGLVGTFSPKDISSSPIYDMIARIDDHKPVSSDSDSDDSSDSDSDDSSDSDSDVEGGAYDSDDSDDSDEDSDEDDSDSTEDVEDDITGGVDMYINGGFDDINESDDEYDDDDIMLTFGVNPDDIRGGGFEPMSNHLDYFDV